MSYPSDLTDKQWAKIEPFFGRPDPRGARSKYPKRRVVEAILYRLREGCRWRALPHDFPPYDTVFDHWQRWQERGVWPQAVALLGTRWREVALRLTSTSAINVPGRRLAQQWPRPLRAASTMSFTP